MLICWCRCGYVGNVLALSIMSTAMRYAYIVDGKAVPGASVIRLADEGFRKSPPGAATTLAACR
jgi:hypothetical protein